MASAKQKRKANGTAGSALQLPLPGTLPRITWSPPQVSALPSWADARRVCIDIETYDPDLPELGPGVRRGGRMVGYSFAIEDGPCHYVPLYHDGGDNVENPESALQYLLDQSRAFRGDLVGANLSYDLDYLFHMGAMFSDCQFLDVQIAEPILNEHRLSYSLESLCEAYEIPGKNEQVLRAVASMYGVDPKHGLWRLPARFVGAYAEADADRPLSILRRQERQIDEEGLWDIYKLEAKVVPILVHMRQLGIRLDLNRLSYIEDWTVQQERECYAQVHHHTGVQLGVQDTWKPGALAKAIEAIGVAVPMTEKNGQASITDAFLAGIDHPVAQAIDRARDVNKLRTTFAASIRRFAVGDRIHGTFNQLRRDKEEGGGGGTVGTIGGRVSMTKPNLQQQPSRDPELSPLWRSIYVAEPGEQWVCADYSQQEPRLVVHYADLMGLHAADLAAQRYRSDPDTDFHTMMSELTRLPRKSAKSLFLGKVYGMGGLKLCRSLDLPTRVVRNPKTGYNMEVAGEEGQRIIDQFDRMAPWAKLLSRRAEHAARRRGYITTLLGRRCRFQRDALGNPDWTHKALSRLIQGGCADQMKKAMVDAWGAGFRLRLQVHDELDLSVATVEEGRALAEVMEGAVPLRVPSKVDLEVGPNWGTLKTVSG